MEEALQAVIRAVERAAYELGNVRGADQSMPSNDAHDLHVVIGKPKWRWLSGSLKPTSSCPNPYSGGDIHTH